ncbi:hypothetical protein ACFOOP_15685 [Marinicaulis aureus]|uniref:Uncharacterized protein n=1 Tax=Hyphococcus aureus TaxID=2666033 RepID=A0ABW1KX62_9PROT
MTGETVSFDKAKADTDKGDSAPRQQSSIMFPNVDLANAVEVAKAVYSRQGLGPCPLDELAAEMNVTMSGNFRLRTSATRMFGFIEKEGNSAVKLTDLGTRLLTPESEADAKSAAFLNVPLYSKIFETYRGKLLPPAKALEREMISLGVVAKQADRARQVFQRSAKEAGFFDSGDDRLVRPRTASSSTSELRDAPSSDQPETAAVDVGQPPSRPPYYGGGGGGSGGDGDYHPFIEGLLRTLPETGKSWSHRDRAKWLTLAANAFDMIYETEEGDLIGIEIKSVKKNGGS